MRKMEENVTEGGKEAERERGRKRERERETERERVEGTKEMRLLYRGEIVTIKCIHIRTRIVKPFPLTTREEASIPASRRREIIE